MSHTPISESPSTPSSCSSSPSRRRSPSHVPLLPTSVSLDDDLIWGINSQGRWKGGVRRKRPIAITFFVMMVLSLFGLAYVTQEGEGLFKVQWVSNYIKPKTTTLLLPRFSDNETFSYYPRPLTNPVAPKWDLDFGASLLLNQLAFLHAELEPVSDDKLTIETLPSPVPVSTSSSITFHCAHSNITMCAQAYRVVFIGPTMRSTPWSDSVPLDERRVKVHFKIADPGDYQVYAWPEHERCHDFQPELHDWKIRPCEPTLRLVSVSLSKLTRACVR